MLSIFNYIEPNEYLKDVWTSKRSSNKQFTIRAWANQLGFKHHNSLHEIVQGKRKIPKDSLPKFINSMNLSVEEGLYFELMVDLSRAKNAEQKTIYLERMKLVAPNKRLVKFTELESFRMLQDPIHFFISELSLQKDFKPDSQWIKERISYPTTHMQISEAIERLIALDILREDAEGRLQRVDQFIQSKSDISDKALKEYHKHIMDLAKAAIDSQDVLSREFQGMAMNVDPTRLPEAKKVIREFVNSFTSKFDTPKVEDEQVYQLNLQFFGITKKTKQEKGNVY